MRPIPLEALAVIYAFAISISYGKWRWALKGAGWTARQKQAAIGLIFATFVSLAALDAFYNHRLGFRQF